MYYVISVDNYCGFMVNSKHSDNEPSGLMTDEYDKIISASGMINIANGTRIDENYCYWACLDEDDYQEFLETLKQNDYGIDIRI